MACHFPAECMNPRSSVFAYFSEQTQKLAGEAAMLYGIIGDVLSQQGDLIYG